MRLRAEAVISLLLFSIIVGFLFVATTSANFTPEEPPPGAIISIDSDGQVIGTGIHRNGNVYTLTGDINNIIVVLRDGIVLDGAGYTLQGNGDFVGVFLKDRSNVTIRNLTVRNFWCGIKLTVGYGTPSAPAANIISGNRIINNTYGVDLGSSNNIFRNNKFENNQYSIMEENQSDNHIDTSNTVNGKPVYYWVGVRDRVVPSDAGWVALKSCNGITVQGLILQGNGAGVLLGNTNGSIISGNIIANNLYGISLQGSSGNVISSNQITINDEYGIVFEHGSNNNVISKNEIGANAKDGVQVDSSVNTTISENHVAENGAFGIYFRNIQDSKVIGNNVTLNKSGGIRFYGPNGTVSGNYVVDNGKGIWLSDAVGNTITLNTVKANNDWGIELDGSQGNNVIHHNNFINNNVNEGSQAHVAGTWTYPGLNKPGTGPFDQQEPPKLIPGNANAWDDGKIGNYWSDYAARYPIASIFSSTNVRGTPYSIDENNMDRYPLVNPWNANSGLPEQQSGEDSAGVELQVEFAFGVLIAGVGLGIASAYLFLKRRKTRIQV